MILKGVMHVHSAYSQDKAQNLRALRELLLRKGIAFCCLSEHAENMTVAQAQLFVQECKALSGSQFVFIPGFKVPCKKAHVLFVGTEVFLSPHIDAQMLKVWSSKSVLTILAHPKRSTFRSDPTLIDSISGLEIWNKEHNGSWVPAAGLASLLRKLQNAHTHLLAFGGLGSYVKEGADVPLYSLEVEHISSDAILRALAEGKYVFGTEKISVSSTGLWKGSGSFLQVFLSLVSVLGIAVGVHVHALVVYARTLFAAKKGS